MTASLQTYARDHLEAIDNLSFAFEILSTPPEDIKVAPADGVVVYGLYLEVRTYVSVLLLFQMAIIQHHNIDESE